MLYNSNITVITDHRYITVIELLHNSYITGI